MTFEEEKKDGSRKKDLFYISIVVVPTFFLLLTLVIGRELVTYDELWHVHMAKLIYENGALPKSDPTTYNLPDVQAPYTYAPLYHLTLAGLFFLFGPSDTLIMLFPVFITCAALTAVYFLGKKIHDERVGFFAMLLFFQPIFFFFYFVNYVDMFACLFCAIFFYCVVNAFEKSTYRSYFFLGVSAGLALSSKQSVWLLLVPLPFIVVWRRPQDFKKFCLSFVVLFLIMTPSMYQNYRVIGSPIIIYAPGITPKIDSIFFPDAIQAGDEEADELHEETFSTPLYYFLNPGTGKIYFLNAFSIFFVLLCFAGLSFFLMRREDHDLALAGSFMLMFLGFSIYPVRAWRYMLVIFPLGCVYAGYALHFFVKEINVEKFNKLFQKLKIEKEMSRGRVVVIQAIVVICILGYNVYNAYEKNEVPINAKSEITPDTYQYYEVDPDNKEAFEWIKENTEKDARILTVRSYLYSYYTDRASIWTTSYSLGDLYKIFDMEPIDSSAMFLYKYDIKYIVIDGRWVTRDVKGNTIPYEFVVLTLPIGEDQGYYKFEFGSSNGYIMIYSIHPPRSDVL